MAIPYMPIALEMYSVRDDFAADPDRTLYKIAAMGYDGVEFFGGEDNNLSPARCLHALQNAGLVCMGYQPNWPYVGRDTLARTLEFADAIGCHRIGIASAPPEDLKQEDTLNAVISHLNWAHDTARAAGFEIGYHAHRTDFVTVNGDTAWNRIFAGTPRTFTMIVDTGNALSGGAWSLPLLERFPGRSPWVHIKPYSLRTGYDTMIGADDFDWPRLLKACVEIGGADTLTVEYCDMHNPAMDGARRCLNELRARMEAQ